MVEIKVKKVHLKNGTFETTARNFAVSISGIPSKKILKESIESIFKIEISGMNGNVHSFISNAVDEETMFFKGRIYHPRNCF